MEADGGVRGGGAVKVLQPALGPAWLVLGLGVDGDGKLGCFWRSEGGILMCTCLGIAADCDLPDATIDDRERSAVNPNSNPPQHSQPPHPKSSTLPTPTPFRHSPPPKKTSNPRPPPPPPELISVLPPKLLEPVDGVGAVQQQRAGGNPHAVWQRVGAHRKLGVLVVVVCLGVVFGLSVVWVGPMRLHWSGAADVWR